MMMKNYYRAQRHKSLSTCMQSLGKAQTKVEYAIDQFQPTTGTSIPIVIYCVCRIILFPCLVSTYVVCERLSVMHELAGVVENKF